MSNASGGAKPATRRRSFSRSRDDKPGPTGSEGAGGFDDQNKAKEERRKDAGRRFSLTGMADLSEFANVDQKLSPEKRLQAVRLPRVERNAFQNVTSFKARGRPSFRSCPPPRRRASR